MKDITMLNKPVYEMSNDNYLAVGEGTFENIFQVGIELFFALSIKLQEWKVAHNC